MILSHGGNLDIPGDPVNSVTSTLAHSQVCFESVMRIYYLRHGYEMADGYLCHAIFELACYALAQRSLLAAPGSTSAGAGPAASPDDTKSTLLLAAKGLSDQSKNYYLPRALFQIVEKEMSAEDRTALHRYVAPLPNPDSESLQFRSTYISSQYPLNIASISDNPVVKRLDQLAKEFTDVAVEKARNSTSKPG